MNIELQQTAQRMTSIEIAELTGKQHKNVMQAIRSMEPAWEKINGLKFQLVNYLDKKGEMRPCYSLTKVECLYIATKFNDEMRAKLIIRWEELERANYQQQNGGLSKMQIMAQAVLLANEEINKLTCTIEQQRPKVEYCDDVLMSEDCVTTTQVAKHFGLSAIALNNKLHELGIQFKQSRQWFLYAKYARMGLAKERTAPYFDSDGNARTAITMVWTEQGKRFLSELIRSDYNVKEAIRKWKMEN